VAPKNYCHVYISSSLTPLMNLFSPVKNFTLYVPEVYFNIIQLEFEDIYSLQVLRPHFSMPFSFPYQWYILLPSCYICFNNKKYWGNIVRYEVSYYVITWTVTSYTTGPNILLRTLLYNTLNLCSPRTITDPISPIHIKFNMQNYSSIHSNRFSIRKRERLQENKRHE
jgi:hypothetical protein